MKQIALIQTLCFCFVGTVTHADVFILQYKEGWYSRSISRDWWRWWSCTECVVHSPSSSPQVGTPVGHRSACGRVGKPCYCGGEKQKKTTQTQEEKMTFREHPRLGIAYLMTEYIRERRVALLSL